MKQKLFLPIFFAAMAVHLTGCAAWNKYDLRQAKVKVPSGSSSICVACVDERDSLRQGEITPELIGVTRSGVGVPYRVKTATKDSVAAEIAGVVTRAFKSTRKSAPPIICIDSESAIAALRATRVDRQILIRIQQYNSDTLINTELDFAFVVEVRDSNGKLLATSRQSEVAALGGNFFLPALHARKSVLLKTGDSLSKLLSDPQIQAVLK
jgi:hypothetical protein